MAHLNEMGNFEYKILESVRLEVAAILIGKNGRKIVQNLFGFRLKCLIKNKPTEP